jgi:hypothetical protein
MGARGDPQLAQRRQRGALVQHLEALRSISRSSVR